MLRITIGSAAVDHVQVAAQPGARLAARQRDDDPNLEQVERGQRAGKSATRTALTVGLDAASDRAQSSPLCLPRGGPALPCSGCNLGNGW